MLSQISNLINTLFQPGSRSFYLSFFRMYLVFHLLKDAIFFMMNLSLVFSPDSFVLSLDDPILNTINAGVFIHGIKWFLSVYVILIILWAAGIGKHFTAMALFIFLEILQRMTGILLNGGDNLLRFLMIYMIFSDSYVYFSLSKLKYKSKTMQDLSHMVTNLATFSILLHLCLVYFITAINKMHADAWFNGIATYYTFTADRFRATDGLNMFLGTNGYIVTISTYATLCLELSFPFLIWNKKLRPYLLIMGMGMHLGILFFMNIHDFQILFIMVYGFFLTDEQFRNFYHRIQHSWLWTALRARFNKPKSSNV